MAAVVNLIRGNTWIWCQSIQHLPIVWTHSNQSSWHWRSPDVKSLVIRLPRFIGERRLQSELNTNEADHFKQRLTSRVKNTNHHAAGMSTLRFCLRCFYVELLNWINTVGGSNGTFMDSNMNKGLLRIRGRIGTKRQTWAIVEVVGLNLILKMNLTFYRTVWKRSQIQALIIQINFKMQ